MGDMMALFDELSEEIWGDEKFLKEFARLERANIALEFSAPSVDSVSMPEITRLLQCAFIFAGSTDGEHQDAAQRISTAAMRILGENDSVKEVFSLIQGRLKNFPSLMLAVGNNQAPVHAPMSLKYEFIKTRLQQTVIVSDGVEKVFTPFQLDSWRALEAGGSAAITGPTSAGKSYVLLAYIVEYFRKAASCSVVYVVPTRALINQVSDDVARELTSHGLAGVTVTAVPVDFGSSEGRKILYVLTQERFESLLNSNPSLQVDLVVVDEAQMIADDTRGVLLEAVIDRVVGTPKKGRFIFSGPMIENPAYFGSIFGLEKFQHSETARSPVTQNVVFLNYSAAPKSEISISSLQSPTVEAVKLPVPIRLLTDVDKVSYIGAMLGRNGSSIVYAAGKADAEKIAIKLSNDLRSFDSEEAEAGLSEEIQGLIKFVKKHVHKDYALVETLKRGVGFHYGHMPSLLRRELEEKFKEKKIPFLVCTSTLLYGLNLPAKNIFLHKPTTGRGIPISAPAFWNLAGRAGRLGKELEGNVFLIDYPIWESKPIGGNRSVKVETALKSTIVDNVDDFWDYLNNPAVSSEARSDLEMVLGKLVLDHRMGRLDETIGRYGSIDSIPFRNIKEKISSISADVDIPTHVLNKNMGVSIFRQKDLLDYLIKRLKSYQPSELIPAHPLGDFDVVRQNYLRAFKRIHTHLLNYPGKDKRHTFFAGLALRWMRGDPLPVLIESSIAYYKSREGGPSIAKIIRDTMQDIEDNLRFRYVKFFTCYNSLLEIALKQSGHDEFVDTIPDIPLFLEMGGSSGAMINLMALGLSRTSAEALSDYLTDKDASLEDLRKWLQQQDFRKFDISDVCIREIEQLLVRI